jgi:hypothetical protein
MSIAASQTKGSGILWFRQGTSETIVIVKHITKFYAYDEYDGTTILEIYTIGSKHPAKLKIARTEKNALIGFLISEQNLVKPKSNTTKILSAAALV